MAITNGYCTLLDLQEYIRNHDPKILKGDATDTLEAHLEQAVEAASRHIDYWVGRDYLLHDYSVTSFKVYKESQYVNIEDKVIVTPTDPIITLTSVSRTVGGSTTTFVEGTDFYVESDILYFTDSFPWSNRSCATKHVWVSTRDIYPIELVGKFGYDQPTLTQVPTGLPSNVQHACVVAAAAISGMYQREVVGIGSREQIFSTEIEEIFYKILGPRRAGFIG